VFPDDWRTLQPLVLEAAARIAAARRCVHENPRSIVAAATVESVVLAELDRVAAAVGCVAVPVAVRQAA
jgi:hypothetical protein